jgi:hypothetical protein
MWMCLPKKREAFALCERYTGFNGNAARDNPGTLRLGERGRGYRCLDRVRVYWRRALGPDGIIRFE